MAAKRNNRKQRVNDVIQSALAVIVQEASSDLDIGMVTITGVEVAPDLAHAKVFVSILDDTQIKETIKKLNAGSKTIRYALAHAVKLRMTPDLKFVYDDSTVRGNRITSLISIALKDAPSDDDNEK
jgi:ribosome-binding factor A